LLNNIFKVSFTKKKQKNIEQRFATNNKKSEINVSSKKFQNNNVFNIEFFRISRISRRSRQLLKKIASNALREIFS